MELSINEKGDYKVVNVIGKIDRLKDSITLKSLLLTLLDNDAKNIALDLSQVSYFDSGALNVFIFCNNSLKKKNGTFCLIEPNEYVMDVLEIVGLTKMITIYPKQNDFEKHISDSK